MSDWRTIVAKKTKTDLARLQASILSKQATLAAYGQDAPTDASTEPPWWKKVAGALNVTGVQVPIYEHNIYNYLKAGRPKSFKDSAADMAMMLEMGATAPLVIVARSIIPGLDSAMQNRGYLDPDKALLDSLLFTGKAVDGGDELAKDLGLEGTPAALVGLASNILQPSTFMGGGITSATKASKLAKAAEVADKVWDAASLAARGIDVAKVVAKHGDEYARVHKGASLAADLAGGLRKQDLPGKLSQEIFSALGKEAGLAQAGTARILHAPFLRKAAAGTPGTVNIGGKGVGLGAVMPKISGASYLPGALGAASKEARAANRLEGATRVAAGDKTLGAFGERLLGWKPTVKRLGVDGAKVGAQFGKHAADLGGIKFMGKTIIDAQPAMDAAVYGAKTFARGTKAGRAIEQTFSRVAPVAARGNELMTAAARFDDIRAGLSKALSVNRAVHEGLDSAGALDEIERRQATLLLEHGLTPAQHEELEALGKEKARLLAGRGAKDTGGKAWTEAATRQMGEDAAEELGQQGLGLGRTDLIDHYNEALAGRRVSDTSILTKEKAFGARAGQNVPFAEEVARLRDAGISVTGARGRYSAAAINEEDALVALKTQFLGIYDGLQTPDDVREAIGAARVMRDKASYAGGKRATKAGKALEETTIQTAIDNPDAVAEALTKRLMNSTTEAESEIASRDLEEFFAWRKRYEVLNPQAKQIDPAAAKMAGAAEIPPAGSPAAALDPFSHPVPSVPSAATVAPDAVTAAERLLPTQVDLVNQKVAGILKSFDYDEMRRVALEKGIEPTSADRIITYLRDTEQPRMEELFAMMRDQGIGSKALYNEGSAGYMRQADPLEPGIREIAHARLRDLGQKHGWSQGKMDAVDLLQPREAKLDQSVLEQFGFDPAALKPIDRRYEVLGQPINTRPAQQKAREFMTASDRLDAGIPMQLDIAKSHALKVESDYTNIGKAQFQERQIMQYGTELGTIEGVGPEAEALAKTRVQALDGEAVRTMTRNGTTVAYSMPEDVSRWMDTLDAVFTNQEDANFYLRTFDRVQNAFKKMATSWNPGFHGRNLASNYFLAATEGIAQPSGFIDAAAINSLVAAGNGDELFTHGGRTLSANDWKALSLEHGVQVENFGPQSVDALTATQVQRGETTALAKGGWAPKNLWAKVKNASPGAVGGKVGEVVEDTSRFGGWLNALDKGLDDEAGALLVNKTFYNYAGSALTVTERAGLKRAIPFYSWMRNNLPHMIEWSAKNPGKARLIDHFRNFMLGATGVDDSSLPSYLREMGAIPTGLKDADGNPLLINPNLPIQDLMKLQPTPQGVFDWAMGQSSPIPKTILELGSNHDYFTGREVRKYTGEKVRAHGAMQLADSLAGGMGNSGWASAMQALGFDYQQDSEGNPYLAVNANTNKVITAASPFLSNLGRSVDPTPGSEWRAGAWLTGVKLSPANASKNELDAAYARDQQLSDTIQMLRARLDASTGATVVGSAEETAKRKKGASRFNK